MEILVFFMFVSLCSFGLLMIAERFDEAIFVGSVLLLIGFLLAIASKLIDNADSGEGKDGQSANVVLVPYSPMAQDIELTMPDIMTAVTHIARAEQGELNYVLRENIGMPAISYHKSSNPPLTEEALPVATRTKRLDTPNTKINNSEHSFYGFEFSRVLNTVLVLFAVTIIALGFWVFNLRTILKLLAQHSARSTRHCEALIDHLENKISTLETNLAFSQMHSRTLMDVPVEKSDLSVHDSASSVLKMRRRLELD